MPNTRFLAATQLIDSNHPAITTQSKKITQPNHSPEENARHIFYFIRDEIRYDFRLKYTPAEYHASYILKAGYGFCTQKAILFCALARSCGIPAGICFYDIIDHSLSDFFAKMLRTRTLFHHGIVALYLNGEWCQYDATIDRHLASRKNYTLVEYFPNRDCLLPSITPVGEKHIEYTTDYGLYTDVSFENIMEWMQQGYPHLLARRTIQYS
ncbi:transglutaminase domain-containing protein [candidate division KSB1 bacterium]|nr:transglutaminase domain-containing protein [candidate division KSB1 bacterium]